MECNINSLARQLLEGDWNHKSARAHEKMKEPVEITSDLASGEPSAAQLPRFVRILNRTAGGLVQFEFSVGWPELSAELVLPQAAFDEFCATNAVQMLDGEAAGDPLRNLEEEQP
jgi:phenol/toluene 2-monooxygenase (NADH) P0/A0